MSKLSAKQRHFVDEYMKDLNATQAAIRAGYASNSAHVQGPRLLGNASVSAEIEKRMIKNSQKAERTAQDAIEDIVRLARIAESNGDIKTAMKGFELEGKHKGAFIERKADVDTAGNDVVKSIEVTFVEPGDE